MYVYVYVYVAPKKYVNGEQILYPTYVHRA